MADQQRIVDDLRAFLQSTDQQLTDALKQLGGRYLVACQEANQRLRRCAEFLAKGLRSEAVHLATTDPPLLDVIAILDFPERRQWEEIAAMYGLPAPPPLDLDTASALNEAYADDQSLEELLRKHRILALGHAPLGPRLRLLRRIAEVDARNPLWADDVREFERARLQQISSTVDGLVRAGNLNALLVAQEELTKAPWQVPPPAPLTAKVQTAVTKLGQQQALAALRALEPQLYDAMSAYNVPRALQLRQEWTRLTQIIKGGSANDPLWQRAKVVFDWLDEQERRGAQEEAYQKSIGILEQSLVSSASAVQLQQLAQNVLRFQRGMPEGLVQRYQAKQRSLRWGRRIRLFLAITVPAAVILLAVAGGLWFVDYRNQRDRVNLAVSTLEKMLEDNQLAEGIGYIENLEKNEPRTANDSRVQALKPRFLGDQRQEDDRQRAFRQEMQKAQDAPLNAEGDRQVQKLEQLARLPRERDEFAALMEDRKKRREKNAKEVDLKLQTTIDDLRRKVAEVEKLPLDSPQAAKQVSELTDEARKLADKASADGAGNKTREDIASLRKQLDDTYGKVREKNLEAILLGDMARALSDKDPLSAYLKAADRYVSQYPDRPRAKAFKKLTDEHAGWQLAVEWSRLADSLGDKPHSLRVKDVKEVNGPLDRCKAFLEKHPQAPDAALIGELVQCLEAIRQRDEADAKSAVAELRKLFSLVYVKDVWYLKTKDGVKEETFYANQDFEPNYKESRGAFIQFKYMVGFDGQTRQASRKYSTVVSYGRAAQSDLAKIVNYLPENFADKSWDDETIALLTKIRARPDIDPFLKFALLKRVTDYATRGSYPLKQALGSFVEGLGKADVDQTLPWMDPEHKEANKARPQVKEAVDKLPRLDGAPRACADEKQRLEEQLQKSQRASVGFLLKDGKEQWQCFALGTLPDGELLVLVPGKEQAVAWKAIGDVRRGKTTLSGGEALAEGRPVFMIRARAR